MTFVSAATAALEAAADSICRMRCRRCGLVDERGEVRLAVLDGLVAFVWLCKYHATTEWRR